MSSAPVNFSSPLMIAVTSIASASIAGTFATPSAVEADLGRLERERRRGRGLNRERAGPVVRADTKLVERQREDRRAVELRFVRRHRSARESPRAERRGLRRVVVERTAGKLVDQL